MSEASSAAVSAEPSQVAVAASLVALTLFAFLRRVIRVSQPVAIYVPYLWAFFLFFTLCEFASFAAGVWVLAILCFLALREYFTLVDLRIQDRLAVWAAYASVPFMLYYIATDWYGMFAISIPVFAFFLVPFLVALGGRPAEGSVVSIGIIDLGLFLLVFCVGHIGYLAYYSTWMAILLVATVTLCDLSTHLLNARERPPLQSAALQVFVPAPLAVTLGLALMPWTGIPRLHTVVLALVIPALVAIGCHTVNHLEADLRIDRSRLRPGRGEIINTLKSYLYAAPIAFHYLRHVLDTF